MLTKCMIRMALLLCFCNSHCIAQQANPIVLRGTLVTPGDIVEDGLVTISGSQIADVNASFGHPPPGAIDTDALIFPGLIDLHDHITWNFLPRWKPGELFNNRYDWQQMTAYKIALDDPHARYSMIGRSPAMRIASVKSKQSSGALPRSSGALHPPPTLTTTPASKA